MLNERSSYSLAYYISRTRPKKNGKCPVYLKITINGDKASFPVKRHIYPNDWSPARSRMKGRTKEADVFNRYLDAILLRGNNLYNELLMNHAEVTASSAVSISWQMAENVFLCQPPTPVGGLVKSSGRHAILK